MHHWNKYYLVIFLLGKITLAQNLVPDPSFELYDSCPDGYNDFSLTHWVELNDGTSNYLNTCSSNVNSSVPLNSMGFQPPKGGGGYILLRTDHEIPEHLREYAGVNLTSDLIKDSVYHISFYVNPPNTSTRFIDGIGAVLTTSPIYQNNSLAIEHLPYAVRNPKFSYITDTANWTKIEGYYTAQGGESFIGIGNFDPYGETNAIGSETGAFMLIDCVSVVKVTLPDTVIVPPPPDTTDQDNYIHVFPNPAHTTASLSYGIVPGSQGNFYLYDASGKLIYRERLGSGKNTLPIDVQNYAAGIYLWQCRLDGGFFKSGKLLIQR